MAVVRKQIGNATYLYSVYQGEWRYLGKEKPIEEWLNRVHCGNAFELLPFMPSESVDCVITSPPYYGLRTYGDLAEAIYGGDSSCEHEWVEERMTLEHENRNFLKGAQEEVHGKKPTTYIRKFDDKTAGFCVKCGAWRGELGLEPNWRMYVDHLVELFREVKRVLKKSGSFWLNIGDTYASKSMNWTEEYANKPQWHPKEPIQRGIGGYQPKCLMGIPWRVAFALIEDGWILRNAVIWFKPNHMPSSAKDRLTQTYEYLFHFVKSRRYYYCLDNIREPHKTESVERWNRALRQKADSNAKLRRKLLETTGVTVASMVPKWFEYSKHDLAVGRVENVAYTDPLHAKGYHSLGKNPGDLLSIPTRPYLEAHFAVFPPELPLRSILASCPPDGVVLDPLAGSGTVAFTCELINHGKWDYFRLYVNEAAKSVKWNLKWILIEINPKYCELAKKRLQPYVAQRSLLEFA
jgi:site-specific DNA-methyltransferase (cytosine-N4-specific)